VPERTLRWDGCANVRDLGGLETEEGSHTRFGSVVRADSVRGLSDRGWRELLDYGVRRVVDLRWHEELAEDPPGALPLEVVHVPLFGKPEELHDVERLAETVTDPVVWRQTQYLGALERFRANFVEAVAAVARVCDGAVVVHCAGGVDRTGLVAALLLRLAGVSRAAIGADYAASAAAWAPTQEEWIASAETEEVRDYRRRLSVIRPETMSGVLEQLEARHESVERFLVEGGADPGELAAARARLRA
jgi:protein-tyrosine phosphatase